MESHIAQPDRTHDSRRTAVHDDPIPVLGPVFAVFACGASLAAWLWFTSPKPNYILHFVIPVPVLLLGVVGHLMVEEVRAGAAAFNFRRHAPLRRNKYYAFALLFSGVAWVSIFFHVPVHARFALSRAAMDAAVADVQSNPDLARQTTMRVGWYHLQPAPQARRDGALMFHLAGDNEAGFTYSTTPIGYPGWNRGNGGRLGGGWYWFSDD